MGTLLLTWWLVAAAGSPAAYGHVQGFVGSWIGLLFLFGWTASLWYHFLAGIRHLFYDAGQLLGIDESERASWAIIIGSVVLTLISLVLFFLV